MSALPIDEAARALGVAPSTLRRWIALGAPVARRGRRGRGHVTLIDPEAIEAWRAAKAGGDDVDAVLRSLAGALPELLADAAFEAFRLAPDKRGAAWAAAAAWQLSAFALHDLLAEHVGALPEPTAIPEPIERLRKIANL